MRPDATVSVVVPCRDAAPFLAETIDAVLDQRRVAVETIVVDDGSTDASPRIARSYGERVRLLRRHGRGACHARNRGARLATGRWLMFLDADDLIAPDTLDALVDALDGRDDRVAVCPWSWLKRAGERWRVVPGLATSPPGGEAVGAWLAGWYVPPCAVLWPRTVFERTGGWDETILADQDGDLMLRALIAGTGLAGTARGHGYYRDHGATRESVSKDVSPAALRSRCRVIERAAARLAEAGRAERYAVAVGRAYHRLAKMAYDADPAFALDCERRAARLAGAKAVVGHAPHRALCRLVGLDRERRIARAVRRTGLVRLARRVHASVHPSFGGPAGRTPDAPP